MNHTAYGLLAAISTATSTATATPTAAATASFTADPQHRWRPDADNGQPHPTIIWELAAKYLTLMANRK